MVDSEKLELTYDPAELTAASTESTSHELLKYPHYTAKKPTFMEVIMFCYCLNFILERC